MAHIVVVMHAFDQFAERRRPWRRTSSNYMLFGLLQGLRASGHRWSVSRGGEKRSADVGILHVDATYVGVEYLSLASCFERTINFGTADISKRTVSGATLARHDNWRGAVVVKSNLNYRGIPEANQNRAAVALGRPPPFPGHVPMDDYQILDSQEAVPADVWADSGKTVERFLPEHDKQGFALRTWVFAGDRERCTRHVSRSPIVKGADIISSSPVAVPEGLRSERRRLQFDYGKFDYVEHGGETVLLDANRTPGAAPNLRQFLRDGSANLLEGLQQLISPTATA